MTSVKAPCNNQDIQAMTDSAGNDIRINNERGGNPDLRIAIQRAIQEVRPRKVLHIGADFARDVSLYSQSAVDLWHLEVINSESKYADSQSPWPARTVAQELAPSRSVPEDAVTVNTKGAMPALVLRTGSTKDGHFRATGKHNFRFFAETLDSLLKKDAISTEIDFLVVDPKGTQLLILEGALQLLGLKSIRAASVATAVDSLVGSGATYLDVTSLLGRYDFHLKEAIFGDDGWSNTLFRKPYWSTSLPPSASNSPSQSDNHRELKDQMLRPEALCEDKAKANYKFLMQAELSIADATTFCPLDKAAIEEDIEEALKLLIPVGCTHPLVRIGGNADGAYLVPDDLESIDACFSPGVGDLVAFEQELAEKHQIPSYLCDASIANPPDGLREGFHDFAPFWLGGFDGDDTQTLDSWVMGSKHKHSKDLLLQMDIEGAEFSCLLAASDSILSRFRIVLVEFHGLERISSSRFLNTRLLPVLHKLNRHFDCVHVHPNNCSGTVEVLQATLPMVIEATYYRKNCNKGGPAPAIPHPLDIINCPARQEILLGRPWRTDLELTG